MWPSTFLASVGAVKAHLLAKKTAWLFCLCILLTFLAEARAQTYSLATESTADLLTISFPKNAPTPVVVRTGAKRVEVLFPAGTKLKGVSGGTVRGRHIANLSVADNVLVVETEGEAFGFAATPKGDKVIQLQVFYDPAGSKWQPSSQEGKQKPEQAAVQPPSQPVQPQEASKQAPSGVAKGEAALASGQGVTGKVEFPKPQASPAPPAQPSTGSRQQPASAPSVPAPQPQPAAASGPGVTGKIETPSPQPSVPQPPAPKAAAPAPATQTQSGPGSASQIQAPQLPQPAPKVPATAQPLQPASEAAKPE